MTASNSDPERAAFRRNLYCLVGKQIASLRTRRKPPLRQQDLAAAIGLSRASLVNIEQGRHRVQLHVLYDLARVLGVDPRDLLPQPPTASSNTLPAEFASKLRPDEQMAIAKLVGSPTQGTGNEPPLTQHRRRR